MPVPQVLNNIGSLRPIKVFMPLIWIFCYIQQSADDRCTERRKFATCTRSQEKGNYQTKARKMSLNEALMDILYIELLFASFVYKQQLSETPNWVARVRVEQPTVLWKLTTPHTLHLCSCHIVGNVQGDIKILTCMMSCVHVSNFQYHVLGHHGDLAPQILVLWHHDLTAHHVIIIGTLLSVGA